MVNMDKQATDAKVRTGLPFSHRWHNRFHLEMPFGLINDPNGLAYFNGEYHIFFQWNPLACEHKNKSWAHTKTADFVNYAAPELAMWPTDAHDKDGCYSGCGFVDDDKLRIFYTCNAKDENGIRTPAQRLGTFANGAIRKEEIAVPDSAKGYTGHFRDPYVFWRHGRKYFVLGAQTKDERGTAVIYREDKDGWTLMGELKTELTAQNKKFGYMWECPGLMNFGDRDVLTFCPQGLEAEDFRYQNIYQSGYLVGHLSLDSMEFYHGEFVELDRGFDFYAPQVFNNADRHILLGWMGMPDKDAEYPTAREGWLYSLTLPRELTLKQGHIYSAPVKEIESLRKSDTVKRICGQNLREVEIDLAKGSEVEFDLIFGAARKIEFSLSYGEEKLAFRYERDTQVMEIDRSGMKLGGRGSRRFKLYADDRLQARILIDRAAVETFFQQGEEAASLLIFPAKDVSPKFTLSSDANFASIDGNAWELDGFNFN